MPPQRPKSQHSVVPQPGAPAPPRAALSTAELSSRRKRIGFRAAVLVLPLVLVALAELGLRWADWGYPTGFFLNAEERGKPVRIENPKFGWRFFPPNLARAPLPISLPATKPAGVCRIFVFGESAALGDPEPAYGFARQLERLLQARHPERKIEVVNVAMTAINSQVIREIARDCAPLQGDAWVIWAGNNEVVGPFGAGTVFGAQAPSRAHIRATLALRRTRLGQLVERGMNRREGPGWEGMELFLKHQVAADDPRLAVVYARFAANLSDIIAAGRKAQAKVLLTTSPVNLTSCPPFASRHRPDLGAAGLAEWDQHFTAGCQAQAEQRFADALAAFKLAAGLDPEFAELIFRRAVCEQAQGSTAAARADFSLARDLDALRFRADSRLNQLVRQTAAATTTPLIDAEPDFAAIPASPGQDLFYDHVHPNFAGHYLLATRFAAALEHELFPAAAGTSATHPLPEEGLAGANRSAGLLPAPSGAAWLKESEVAERLAYTDFDRRQILEEMRSRLRQPPFKAQMNFAQRDQWFAQELGAPATPLPDLAPRYRTALALAPDDGVLHGRFARLLEATDDATAAAGQWHEALALTPHDPDAWFHLGNLEHNAGRLAEAAACFQKALECRANCLEAINGLGLVLAAQGKGAEAIGQFQKVLQTDPRFSAARVNLGLVFASRGDTPTAVKQYREALRLDPDNASARINLAKLLASLGQNDEAIVLYGEALRFKPEDPVAHFDLANALAARNQHPEALTHYEAAARQRPSFAQARYNLAVELARAGRIPEALAEFGEAVRLEPNSPEVRYNYGIALAKVRRYSEAVRELQEAVNRKPDFPAARDALQRARDLSKSSGGL